MKQQNDTQILQFLLLGLSENTELQPLIYWLFFSMYLVTVWGNLIIILATVLDFRLHTAMYFFLCNLSFVDICLISTTIPKMLANVHLNHKAITYEGCIMQIYFFTLFVGLDNFLLAVMAYDRFVAICHPLRYTSIMTPHLCMSLVLVSWIASVLNSSLQSFLVLQLSFCTEVEIPHFFCELSMLVHLACSDTFLSDMAMNVLAALLGGGCLVGILYSYSKIVSSIQAISSAEGKYKAFSTCVSHLSVVSLFYCTLLGVYLSSAVTQNSHSTAATSLMYTVVTPMLNPFIYSLRNDNIKRALKNFVKKKLEK
ncbi:olfactory receptor 1073 [Rattus norvegicus]|uniref:Olfactory receptor 1073 n=2 Tax=Rattus norvegicus TaxID=10116 RepID=O1073_RAT|nr:olfactory receptor 1073 [Rattus norvegicus]P35898.2 RecName: Full=Olfactory receptor 1073; AltName: Full=Putative gustatory receptor PTE45 [Rattus norvegicus]|eukprot:NP_001000998.1 olfactory receptor 1073 [Rattus norvegicus]